MSNNALATMSDHALLLTRAVYDSYVKVYGSPRLVVKKKGA